MARVPTWTELRLDAEKLVAFQDEFDEKLDKLLHTSLPELDRKILSLDYDKILDTTLMWPIHERTIKKTPNLSKPKISTPLESRSTSTPISSLSPTPFPPSIPKNNIVDHQQTQQAVQMLPEKRSYPDDNLPATKSPKRNITKSPKLNIIRSQTLNENLYENCVNNNINGFKKKINPPKLLKRKDVDFNKFPHLRPLDRPISEYLRINRPEVVLRADRRMLYLRKRAEKRKFLASSKIINSLEQIRISSRSSTMSNRIRQNQNNRMNNNRDNYHSLAPDYHVKSKLTEHEMKRLTARIYNRLPEVKRKRKEEVTNHMKVQNYKNKLEYGRKLLENRRHGIINYPLRLSYDDRSIDTSQDEYSITTNGNNYIGSADLSSSIDPYY